MADNALCEKIAPDLVKSDPNRFKDVNTAKKMCNTILEFAAVSEAEGIVERYRKAISKAGGD